MEKSLRVIFLNNNLRVQFDVVFDPYLNDSIFDSLAPLSGEL